MWWRAFLTSLAACVLVAAPSDAQSPLELEVFTADSPAAPTSTLVMGSSEAVLIDAQFRQSDARALADVIEESGRELTAIYITHPHPDHYLGLAVLGDAFPGARIYALPVIAAGIEGGLQDLLIELREAYGDEVPETIPPPEFLESSTLFVDGETLEIIGPVAGGAPEASSYVWIASLGAVIAGDLVFSNGHPPIPGTPEELAAWEATVNHIASLEPRQVVSGHLPPGSTTDASAIAFTRDYFAAYRELRAASDSAGELEAALLARYPDLALEWMAAVTARGAFPGAP